MRSRHGADQRPWTFYALAAFFTLFVLFLYGPMCAIYLLSFQGPNGGLTFPMRGVSLQWFAALFAQQRTGDVAGAFLRSILLAVLVLGLTVVLSVMAGLALSKDAGQRSAAASPSRPPALTAPSVRQPGAEWPRPSP